MYKRQGMSRVIKKLKNKDILIIPITMTLLSICGTTFGLSLIHI